MKRFLYCENVEGGMNHFEATGEKELRHLYGWMVHGCKTADSQLLQWMETAEVEALQQLLRDVSYKRSLYRTKSSGEYLGGVEYTEL